MASKRGPSGRLYGSWTDRAGGPQKGTPPPVANHVMKGFDTNGGIANERSPRGGRLGEGFAGEGTGLPDLSWTGGRGREVLPALWKRDRRRRDANREPGLGGACVRWLRERERLRELVLPRLRCATGGCDGIASGTLVPGLPGAHREERALLPIVRGTGWGRGPSSTPEIGDAETGRPHRGCARSRRPGYRRIRVPSRRGRRTGEGCANGRCLRTAQACPAHDHPREPRWFGKRGPATRDRPVGWVTDRGRRRNSHLRQSLAGIDER